MSPAERTFRQDLVALLPRLRRFAMSLCRSADVADDLVQTAVERAIRAAHTYDQTRRLDSWMFKIVRNAWLDRCKEASGRFLPMDDIAEPSVDERASLEARSELRRTADAFAQLPEEQRAVLTLVVLEGFSYKDASETLNVPIGTVMSRLARGRAALLHAVRMTGVAAPVTGTSSHG